MKSYLQITKNKVKIKPCARLPGQGVKMSNVSQNGSCHGKLVILGFYVIENLVQSLHLNYLNNCLIPDTYVSHIEDVSFAKYCPIKTKEEAYIWCWIHHLWQYSECYRAFFMSFLLHADYLLADYRAEITVYAEKVSIHLHTLTYDI